MTNIAIQSSHVLSPTKKSTTTSKPTEPKKRRHLRLFLRRRTGLAIMVFISYRLVENTDWGKRKDARWDLLPSYRISL